MPKASALAEKGLKTRIQVVGPSTATRPSIVAGVAPFMSQMTNEVVFGQVWSRTDKLDRRSRRLCVITALISLRNHDELKVHIKGALRSGDLTKEELGEVITHMAFYLGWPTAVGATRAAKLAIDELEAEGVLKPTKKS